MIRNMHPMGNMRHNPTLGFDDKWQTRKGKIASTPPSQTALPDLVHLSTQKRLSELSPDRF